MCSTLLLGLAIELRQHSVDEFAVGSVAPHSVLPLALPRAVSLFELLHCSYVMLRYNEDTLLFDERFINYGCNKVQYVDHLRYQGYSFYIPSDVFSVDLVHRE